MTFKEFKKSKTFKTIDKVKLFWDESGQEVPETIPEAKLDELEVVHATEKNGYLHIMVQVKVEEKRTVSNGIDTFEIVDCVPKGYKIWGIGKNAPEGYIPLYRTVPGADNRVDRDNLKAVPHPYAYKVLLAVSNRYNTPEKMERFVREHIHADEYSWEYRTARRIQTALRILKDIRWEK